MRLIVLPAVQCLLLLTPYLVSLRKVDYWSSNFDIEQNCVGESELPGLDAAEQCAQSSRDKDDQAFQRCKIDLSHKLITKCSDHQVKQTGKLIYCKKRGVTKCCFKDYTCFESWPKINDVNTEKALAYLSNTTAVLDSFLEDGYKSCRSIDGYDASECAKDCEKYEGSEFAKDCTNSGGFFKCCIRRDKRACHECRFCCTLPFCTLKDGTVMVEHVANVTDSEYKQSAIEKMYPLSTMYKTDDYRCYDPKSAEDPAKWKYYKDQMAFRSAKSQQEFDQLQLQEFDTQVLNFEDPEVFKLAVGKNYAKFWKTVYGFDFVDNDIGKSEYTITEAIEYCEKSRHGEFAKRCKKSKGFFKCCITGYSMRGYHTTRVEMYKKGFLKERPDDICGKDYGAGNCDFTGASQLCTIQNPITTELTTEFKTKIEEKYQVGGYYSGNQSLGLRLYYCTVLNTCEKQETRGDITGTDFEKIHDQQGLCQVFKDVTQPNKGDSNSTDQEKIKNFKRKEEMVEIIEKKCNQSKTIALICPRKELAKKYGNLKELKHLRKVLKRKKGLTAKKKFSGRKKRNKSIKKRKCQKKCKRRGKGKKKRKRH